MPAAKKKEKPQDLFMQFFPISGVFGAAANVLKETRVPTNLSIRGGLMWLVHQVEWELYLSELFQNALAQEYELEVALSTRAGLATMPRIVDAGCVAKYTLTSLSHFDPAETGNLADLGEMPKRQHFLPPVPLAAANLSVYALCNRAGTMINDEEALCRIGYTTAELDEQMYLEIAETWGYAVT